jgi:hypothetical protein
MAHYGPCYVNIVRQTYQRGDKFMHNTLVEVKRDGKKRIYKDVSKCWVLWLEAHTSALIFTNDRCYPQAAFDRLGIPNADFNLRRK